MRFSASDSSSKPASLRGGAKPVDFSTNSYDTGAQTPSLARGPAVQPVSPRRSRCRKPGTRRAASLRDRRARPGGARSRVAGGAADRKRAFRCAGVSGGSGRDFCPVLGNFNGLQGGKFPCQKRRRHARESGHPDLAARAGALDSRFRGNDTTLKALILNDATPIGPNLDVYAVAATYSDRREISLANWNISLAKRFCFAKRLASY